MDYVLSGIAFFLIFSIIVLVHEGGHFLAAKLGKIKTEEFGLGLPPRIWGKKFHKDGTLFSFNWIPFGGFVKLLGEDGKSKKKDAFGNAPMWARILTVCAGVFMNFVLGFLLLSIGYMVGMKPLILNRNDFDSAVSNGAIVLDDTKGIFVNGVVPGSPADKVGIQNGDYITAIDIYTVSTTEKFLEIKSRGLRGREFHLSVARKDWDQDKIVKSFVALVAPDKDGNLGIYLTDDKPIVAENEVRYSPLTAMGVAARDTGKLMFYTVKMLGEFVGSLVRDLSVPDSVGGPVAIAQVTYQFVLIGIFSEFLKLAALVSISIGVVNIMPFPALDGGRLALLLFELITRKKPNQTFEKWLNFVGFALLILLLIFITKNDILRIFS